MTIIVTRQPVFTELHYRYQAVTKTGKRFFHGWIGPGTNKKGRLISGPLYTFPLLLLPLFSQAALAALFLSAQRFFIISEMRLLAAALSRRRPRLPLPAILARPRRPLRDPRKADIACSRRSLSASNSEMICCVSI